MGMGWAGGMRFRGEYEGKSRDPYAQHQGEAT